MRMKFLKASLAFLATCVLAWLMTGFIAWDLNPANWDAMQRVALVGLASWFGPLAAAAAMGAFK